MVVQNVFPKMNHVKQLLWEETAQKKNSYISRLSYYNAKQCDIWCKMDELPHRHWTEHNTVRICITGTQSLVCYYVIYLKHFAQLYNETMSGQRPGEENKSNCCETINIKP